ncbi:hypothetical protein [Noviherbaspirillum sp.]|uniref:hypothetical protein n=1 Tax=Noviherbaspirillum sp. TaxID=1926288 RepID=UPI002FDF34B7
MKPVNPADGPDADRVRFGKFFTVRFARLAYNRQQFHTDITQPPQRRLSGSHIEKPCSSSSPPDPYGIPDTTPP